MRYVYRGGILVFVVGVFAACAPVWGMTRETRGHTYARDEDGLHISGGIRTTAIVRVPFRESDFYRWFKKNEFNLLLLIP